MQSLKRINSLDNLRALAIITVFIHNFYYADNQIYFGIITTTGWIGVDLFFALSGYLIANQIFAEICSSKCFLIKRFLIKRIFRIVPNYAVLILLYLMFPLLRDRPVIPHLWQLMTFTTNLNLKTGTGFSYSWSLCVEEQFYLIFAMFIFLIIRNKKLNNFAWASILFLLIIGITYRYYAWNQFVHTGVGTGNINIKSFAQYQNKIYFQTLSRMDDIICGITVAFIKNYYNQLWQLLIKNFHLLIICFISLFIFSLYLFTNYHYGLFATIIGYPMLGLSFGLLILIALNENLFLYKISIPGLQTIAILSFAIYLLEKPLNHLVIKFITHYKLLQLNNPFVFIICIAVSLIGSYLLYILIEQPFLNLRNKLYK